MCLAQGHSTVPPNDSIENTYDLLSETLSILFRSGEDVDILSPCLKLKGNYKYIIT